MRSLHIAIAGLWLALAFLPLAVSAQETKDGEDPLVATVNGEKIHRSAVLEAARNLPPQYQAQLQMIYPMLVQRLVDFQLLAEAAKAAGLAKDDEVKRRVAALERDVMREVYLERRIGEQISEAALRERYATFLADNPAQPEVHARHILLEDEAAAKEVIAELDQGGDFAELARERSTGPSAAQGGDLGYFTKDQMVAEFSEQAFALETGKYSNEPVKTQFGWHVIKVEDRRDSQPPGFDDMQGQLREELSRDVVNSVLSDLRDGAQINLVTPPPELPQGADQ